MNLDKKENIIKILDHLTSTIQISKSHDVYKYTIDVINGATEICPVQLVGYGKRARYIDRTDETLKFFKFLKISCFVSNDSPRNGKLGTKIKILE